MKKGIVLLVSALLFGVISCNKKGANTDGVEQVAVETVEGTTELANGLTGSWELVSIDTEDSAGKTVNELFPQNLPNLTFEADLKVNGNDGCNSIFGTYELIEANGISIGDKLAVTRMFCDGVSDIAFTKALNETNNYEITDGKLLFKANDKVVLTFSSVNAK